ncbi:hypothetical protein CC86DRAFT_383483 [Ophiobolus disseminans]|uniref:Ankyrin n=1 Tax=Ophiobolus disseminans TaxID=1469910 RepID=A0A6A6ZUE5_9PLEO|nr:hypothetical protein CC86DRAFT_383483 [Ophiobolus disseminans]
MPRKLTYEESTGSSTRPRTHLEYQQGYLMELSRTRRGRYVRMALPFSSSVEQVIRPFVLGVGIQEAWRTRGVCRLFSRYIEDAIHLLPFILERRSRATNVAPGTLPSAIPKIVAIFMRITNQATEAERASCTQLVCADVVRLCPEAYDYTFMLSHELTEETTIVDGSEEALCIAIAQKDRTLVCDIIRDGTSIWGKAAMFDTMLDFAIDKGNVGVIEEMIAQADLTADENDHGVQMRKME